LHLAYRIIKEILIKNYLTMAKASGIIKIEGTVEDLTFYKKDGKNFVRRKEGIPKERLYNEPSFERTRENNTESHRVITKFH
jgi:hypothetical protein